MNLYIFALFIIIIKLIKEQQKYNIKISSQYIIREINIYIYAL